MQKLIFDEPYEFIPPHRGKLVATLFKFYLRRYLRKAHGIISDECRGIDPELDAVIDEYWGSAEEED